MCERFELVALLALIRRSLVFKRAWVSVTVIWSLCVDGTLLDAARTLRARPFRVFARVALPLAAAGLGAASGLALARGLGEFGATLLFAGSLQGVTQTLPLAVYAQFEVNLDTALAIGAVFVCFGIVVLLALKLIPGWTRSVSLWTFRSASSPSA